VVLETIYYILESYRNLNKLLVPRLIAKAKAKTEYIEAVLTRDKTLLTKRC
jgi:hypothetical protein